MDFLEWFKRLLEVARRYRDAIKARLGAREKQSLGTQGPFNQAREESANGVGEPTRAELLKRPGVQKLLQHLEKGHKVWITKSKLGDHWWTNQPVTGAPESLPDNYMRGLVKHGILKCLGTGNTVGSMTLEYYEATVEPARDFETNPAAPWNF